MGRMGGEGAISVERIFLRRLSGGLVGGDRLGCAGRGDLLRWEKPERS